MAKLVILTQGMTGRAHELNVDRTTIGRVEDNTFQIADPSVSSHHCEAHLRGGEVLIRDLNSTNGTYINGAQITESVLKSGQTLRLGQIELKLEAEGSASTAAAPVAPTAPTAPAAPATPSAPAVPAARPTPAAPPKKAMDTATMVMPRGVSLSELEGGGRKPGLDTTSSVFSKKRNKTGLYFWIGAGIAILVIIGLIIFAVQMIKSGGH
jgi:pSer/pThr/pTyr-binding forkhead associated (FHA) protein